MRLAVIRQLAFAGLMVLGTGALGLQRPLEAPIAPVREANSVQGIGLFPEQEIPTTVKHFGLYPDRGLPIATIPVGRGELIVGAQPKAWRTAFVATDVNMVFSNFFPSWLPTKLYGNNWYHLDDWRAHVWASSGDSTGRRLEITNGLDFLECTADGAPAGSQFLCPEEPGVKVDIGGVQLHVTYPNGTRNIFEREDQSGTAQTGRYALMWVQRLAEGGSWETIKTYTRNVVTPQGRIVNTPGPSGGFVRAPEYMIGMITTWGSVPGAGATLHPVSRMIMQWKDANAVTRDCKVDPAVEQCSNGLKCYDRICDTERPITQAQECFAWRCDSWSYSVSSWFTSSSYTNTCKQLICSGSDPCWNNTVCEQPRPGGDWKLSRIIMPGTIHPDTNRSLIWTFYYSGKDSSESKFLRLIEDNRGPFGAQVGAGNAIFSGRRPGPGNAIQFGYDKLKTNTLMLKMVAFEAGLDHESARFEFSNYGLIQKLWTTHVNPTRFLYDWDDQDVASPTRVTIMDPPGTETKKTFAPIGRRAPTSPASCDPKDGCNIQLGLSKLEPPTGGAIVNEYAPASAGHSAGMLVRTTDVDGTVATYQRDNAKFGRLDSFTIGCQTEEYQYAADDFPTFPTKVTSKSGTTVTKVEDRLICRPGAGVYCPPYEYGQVIKRTTSTPSGTTLVQTTTFTPGASRTVMEETGGASPLSELMALETNREPVFGRPKGVSTTGASSEGTQAVDSSATDGSNQDCDATNDYCGGVKSAVQTRTAAQKVYFPSDGDLSADRKAALLAIGVSAPTGPRQSTSTIKVTGGQKTEETTSGPQAAAVNTKVYDTWTGNVLYDHQTDNGVKTTMTYRWGDAEYTNTAGVQYRPHPTALLSRKDSVEVGAGSVVVGGFWNNFDEVSANEPYLSHLGPMQTGHYKADGSRSPPDFERLETWMRGRSRVIGCPYYSPPGSTANSCYSSAECLCGGFCAQAFPYSRGICAGSRVDPNLVCRRTFLQDSNETIERNADGTSTLHNNDWFKQQCVQPPCLSGFAGCDNPRY